jgi:hypothetical protein
MSQPVKYQMPHVEAGMSVMWSPGNGSGLVPGIVTKVGVNTIEVSVLRTGATSFVPKAAVRHHTDPGFTRLQDPSKTGCWVHTDQDALLAAMAYRTLGRAEAKRVYPGLAYLVDAYTPEITGNGSDPGDDPDYVGA